MGSFQITGCTRNTSKKIVRKFPILKKLRNILLFIEEIKNIVVKCGENEIAECQHVLVYFRLTL